MDKEQPMDSEEPDKQNNNEEQEENSDPLLNVRDVFSTTRLRRGSVDNAEANGFLIDYHFIFLPIVSCILWCLYIFI